MANLHIIDQSLTVSGGHHFDYTCCLLEAAAKIDLPVSLGANRSFQSSSIEGLDFQPTHVSTCFRNSTYQKVSFLAGLKHLKRDRSAGKLSNPHIQSVLNNYRNDKVRKRRRKLIAEFAVDLRTYFEKQGIGKLNSSDHVFLTTVSELELMGLAIFLANSPWTRAANWHLQFHYNLFDGRTPEYRSQSETHEQVRNCFSAALSSVRQHRLNFYCTTDELVHQYNQLQVVDFHRLTYPVDARFHSTDHPSSPRRPPAEPLNIVCPGELRREKGHTTSIQPFVDKIWNDLLRPGKCRLSVQRPKRRWPRNQKLVLDLPQQGQNVDEQNAVQYLQHPLSKTDYVSLIHDADIGVLFHDSRVYFSRRAGVLGELLACGKPVVVPAGSWLARQIEEAQFLHLEHIAKQLTPVRIRGIFEQQFDSSNVPLEGGRIAFDAGEHSFSTSVKLSDDENVLVVWFQWHDPPIHGVDAGLQLSYGNTIEKKVVGHRDGDQRVGCMFKLPEHSDAPVKIEFTNMFGSAMATIGNLEIQTFHADDLSNIAESAVGLSAHDATSYAHAISEIHEHFDHYRESAIQFSKPWSEGHCPVRLIGQLTGLRAQSTRPRIRKAA